MKRLKTSEIPALRHRLHGEQSGRCAISGIQMTDPVLDHEHASGLVRGVLQREINSFEGKVVNAYRRYVRHLGVPLEEVLLNMVQYQKFHSKEAIEAAGGVLILHPTFKTQDEKRLLRNKRAKRRRARAKK